MRITYWTTLLAVVILPASLSFAAGIAPPNVTVGESLEVVANVDLDIPAPPGGLELTLTSGDPARVRFSRMPEDAGSATLKLTVPAGYRGSPDYYIQGFAKTGKVTYTASAPGFDSGTGTVTLAPSGLVIARSGMGVPALVTTTGAAKTDLILYSALLDSDYNFVHPQPVAGGRAITVSLSSSNPKVGAVAPVAASIPAGWANAGIEFRPLTAGETTVSLAVPEGFSVPAQFARLAVTVLVPGIAVSTEISLGRNLEAGGTVSLGEPAPAGGVTVTLTSNDPAKLLLSAKHGEPGTDCIRLQIPAGGAIASYRLHGLADAGDVTYTASAPGFRSRVGTVSLTPSGVVLGGPQGPPDEAELLSKEIAEGPHGFVTSLSVPTSTIVTVYSVQLDPQTRRGADLTVQPVRAGVSIKSRLTNSNPAAGTLKNSEWVIPAGSSSAVTHFIPTGVGSTEVSLLTPEGYTKAANSTSLTITVQK